jgi:pseudouridine kinase
VAERLSEKEQVLLELIQQNPYISQQELANALNISRPTVANLISGLIKKGYIMGRAYVLAGNEPIVCIGGANVDRKFSIKESAQMGTSNPAKSSQSVGGVARNIGENLGRLGLDVTLITSCGKDSDWGYIEEVSSPYMNLEHVIQISNASTGSYTAVLDSSGEMIIALADMEVYDWITPQIIELHEPMLKRASCIIADLNTPKNTLQYLNQFARTHNKPLVFIPVSAPKMKRLPEELSGVTWLITNRDETETYFQEKIDTLDEWKNALQKWLSLGVQNVIITNGKEGALIGNSKEVFHIPAIPADKIIDVTGAGDAFSSAVIYSWLEGKTLQEIGRAGNVNAFKTLQSPYTVRIELSAQQLQQDMEEL